MYVSLHGVVNNIIMYIDINILFVYELILNHVILLNDNKLFVKRNHFLKNEQSHLDLLFLKVCLSAAKACMLTAQYCNLIHHPSFKPIHREPISELWQPCRSNPGTCVWKDRRKVNDLRSPFRLCGVQVSKLRGIAAVRRDTAYILL